MSVTKQFMDPTGYGGREILWKSMGSINCLVTNILQNILFVFNRRKKFI